MHWVLDMVDLAARSHTCIGVSQQSKTQDKSLEKGWSYGCTFGNNLHKGGIKKRAERRDKMMIKSEPLIQWCGEVL